MFCFFAVNFVDLVLCCRCCLECLVCIFTHSLRSWPGSSSKYLKPVLFSSGMSGCHLSYNSHHLIFWMSGGFSVCKFKMVSFHGMYLYSGFTNSCVVAASSTDRQVVNSLGASAVTSKKPIDRVNRFHWFILERIPIQEFIETNSCNVLVRVYCCHEILLIVNICLSIRLLH